MWAGVKTNENKGKKMKTVSDRQNYKNLCKSLNDSKYNVEYKKADRETESLYRFGWFIIDGYKYSISAWSFKKGQVTFEMKNGTKVKYSIPNHMYLGETDFKKDTFIEMIIKKFRTSLSKWLKDLSDKLQS